MKKTTLVALTLALVLALGALVLGPAARSFAQENPTIYERPIQMNSPDTISADDEAALQHAIDVALNANWGDNVTVSVDGSYLVVQSNGIPDHNTGEFPAPGIPNEITEQTVNLRIPLLPKLADTPTEANMGTIGAAISGAVFFNPYDSGGIYAIGAVVLDECNAHPSPTGQYHYHGVPYCITDAVDSAGQHSVLIGYALDGFAVYGAQDANGDAPTDLDACSGHFGPTPEFPDGVYHYHTTETAPYIMSCYSGVVSNTGGGRPAGGQQQPIGDNRPTRSDRPQQPRRP
ncbi:MAG: YHYH protein [Candidatus Promineifilaceae bacterium]